MPSSRDSHDQYLFGKTKLVASFALLTGKDMDLIVFLNFIFFLYTAFGQSFTSKVCREKYQNYRERVVFVFRLVQSSNQWIVYLSSELKTRSKYVCVNIKLSLNQENKKYIRCIYIEQLDLSWKLKCTTANVTIRIMMMTNNCYEYV